MVSETYKKLLDLTDAAYENEWSTSGIDKQVQDLMGQLSDKELDDLCSEWIRRSNERVRDNIIIGPVSPPGQPEPYFK